MGETDAIWNLVLAHSKARAALVEQACEEALQGGVCGVLVYRDENGDERIGPHPKVPYGMIHEYQGVPPWLPGWLAVEDV